MNKLWNCAKPYRLLCNTIAAPSKYVSPQHQFAIRRCFVGQQTQSAAFRAIAVPSPNATTPSAAALHQRLMSTSTNTNLAKDVIIYKYENPKFFKYMNIFAYCQFIFWGYLAHFAYTELRDVPVDPSTFDDSTSWWRRRNLGDNKYRIGMTAFSLGIGYIILSLSWLYTLRSVRFLVLRKGGEMVSMVMYGPFGRNRIMNVPVNCVSALETRQAAKVVLPLKLKGSRMFYMLDMRGEYLNTQLFDNTVGLKRRF